MEGSRCESGVRVAGGHLRLRNSGRWAGQPSGSHRSVAGTRIRSRDKIRSGAFLVRAFVARSTATVKMSNVWFTLFVLTFLTSCISSRNIMNELLENCGQRIFLVLDSSMPDCNIFLNTGLSRIKSTVST